MSFWAFCSVSLPQGLPGRGCLFDQGAIVRGDTSLRRLALVFTGGDYADGGPHIRGVLRKRGVKASFFFTGDFYRDPQRRGLIRELILDGHYLGPHSDKHLLYCSWADRDKTLVGREEFRSDLLANSGVMETYGLKKESALFFIPPFEWYNRQIARWSEEMGVILFNFTPGTSSNADYTVPSAPEYLSSETIFRRILDRERADPHGFNGFILLLHIGTHPDRTDKFYSRLEEFLTALFVRGYKFARIDELLR